MNRESSNIYLKRIQHVEDYREAIRAGCSVLEAQGCIRPPYFDAIMDTISKFGTYFYLGKGICLPHAEANGEVYGAGICFVLLDKPADFLGHPTKAFIVLAAPDASSHKEMLRQIAALCMSETGRKALLSAQKEEDIRKAMESAT